MCRSSIPAPPPVPPAPQGALHRRPLAPHQPLGERGGARAHGQAARRTAGILNIRRETVEHPFGSIKQWMNQGAFLMRGLGKVRGEFSLTTLAYNLRRAITIIGIPGMIRAVKA